MYFSSVEDVDSIVQLAFLVCCNTHISEAVYRQVVITGCAIVAALL